MSNYFNLKEPGSFSGLSGYSKNQNIPYNQAKEELLKIPVYLKHKNLKRKFKKRTYIVSFPRDQIQIDLIDLSRYSRYNDGFRYILHGIDCFTREKHAIAIKRKNAPTTFEAFKKLLELFKEKPRSISSDIGGEFKNTLIDNYLRDNKIQRYLIYSSDKASIIESAHRLLLSKIFRYFTYTDKKRYIDVLADIVESTNNTYHRSIGMTPNQVNETTYSQVWDNLYKKLIRPKPKPIYKLGDKVHISKLKNVFSKGYKQNFTDEEFIISKINKTDPVTYLLKDLQSEDITGGFYKEELVPASKT